MDVTTIKENEDGSANVIFDLTPEEADAMIRYGILEALKAGIKAGEKLKVDGEDLK